MTRLASRLFSSRPSAPTGLIMALLAILAVLAYLNTLSGKFVYDDRKQILENHLIQRPDRLGEALTSDVWAFKGERPEAWSNYWRPTFVLWMAACHRSFGLGSPFGWHLANLLLHALVTALAFLVVVRLRFSNRVALATAGVFAVHPAHVESVAWISGSPDLLAVAPFLGVLLLMLPGGQEPTGRLPPTRWAPALLLFALALGAKEIALTFPLVLGLAVAARQRGEGAPWASCFRLAWARSWPFLLSALVFFALRWRILGQLEIETPWRMGPAGLLLTAPSVLAFYLKQCFLPLSLGPSYPLRAVTLDNLDWPSFGWPLLTLAAAGALAVWAIRRDGRLLAAAALFLPPLLPALNVNAFIQEQLVHDRYLYLPLLGAWLLLWGALEPKLSGRTGPATLVALGVLLALFGLQTLNYNRAWGSEIELWRRGVAVDPSSSFNRAQLGQALLEAGHEDEALAALDQTLALRPVTVALLGRAEIFARRGRFAEAEADLRLVQRDQPDNPLPYEQLALLFERQGQLDLARVELERGREAVPFRRCAMASNLAVVLYRTGRKDAARAELEAVYERIGREMSPACHRAAFHLGSLYLEGGENARAAAAYRLFLEVSGAEPGVTHQGEAELRRRAEEALRRLSG